MNNNLLLDDKPLVVIPALAVAVGLEESIVLQQLHYWLQRSNNERDGRKWVYNTLAEWKDQFPFWSVETVRRILNGLRQKGLVNTACYNEMKIDRTLWYSIDYEQLNTICRNQQMDYTDSTHACIQNRQTNNQRIPENTTNTVVVVEADAIAEIFKMWDSQTQGTFTSISSDILGGMIDTYGPAAVKQAILDAEKQQKRTLGYVEGILRNRLAGTEPQKGGSSGSNRRSGSDRKVGSAEAKYVIPEWG